MNYLKLLFTFKRCGFLSKESCKVNLVNSFRFSDEKNLYTAESLKITGFIRAKENGLRTIPNQDSFKSQMNKSCETDSNYLVFSNDLKKMIRIAESDEDLLILHKMIVKFNLQSHTLRFQSFNFGPEIIRLYYVLNKPVEAIALYDNEKFSDLLHNNKCYVLLLDMLFKNEMYKEIIMMFKLFSEKQAGLKKLPNALIIIFLGACYKLNTPESYEDAAEVWKMFSDSFKRPYRGVWFFSMLAVKQNHSYVALEILPMYSEFSVPINLKAMALAKEKRYDDVLYLLKEFLFCDKPKIRIPGFVSNETLEFLEKEFDHGDEEQIKRFQKIKQELIAHDFLTHEPLDKYLCEEIEYKVNKPEVREKNVFSVN